MMVPYSSPQFSVVWDTLISLLEIPKHVSKLKLTIEKNSLIEIDVTYYPEFIGEVPVTHEGEKIVWKAVGEGK